MIKVGQIYKTQNGLRYIITYMGNYNIYLLYDTGYSMEYSISSMKKNYDDKLIAEYPTWQEAVNSKEFKTVDNGRCIEDNTPHKESTVLFKTENE